MFTERPAKFCGIFPMSRGCVAVQNRRVRGNPRSYKGALNFFLDCFKIFMFDDLPQLFAR